MTILQRTAREPNAVGGLILAVYGVLVAFHVIVLTAAQFGAVTGLGGAAVIALRWLVTPASEVVASQRPDQVQPVAGPASDLSDGAPVAVVPDSANGY